MLEKNVIEVAPLAFMRGRTLNDAFIIMDEAQNTTIEQMKMFLTRMGANSKAVITGDITQIDLPNPRKSGLVDAINVLDGVEGIHFCHFEDCDVVRHALVQRIVRAYESGSRGSRNCRWRWANRSVEPGRKRATRSRRGKPSTKQAAVEIQTRREDWGPCQPGTALLPGAESANWGGDGVCRREEAGKGFLGGLRRFHDDLGDWRCNLGGRAFIPTCTLLEEALSSIGVDVCIGLRLHAL